MNRSSSCVSRRQFLFAGASLCAGGFLSSCANKISQSGKSDGNCLNIYSWADYTHPDGIAEFEKRFGVRVVYDTYASNEALLAKLQAGAANYDVIVPSDYLVSHLKALGLLHELDPHRLPNLKHLMKRFQNPIYDPGCHYAVPYLWGTTGIGFNAAFFGGRENNYPCDWDVFWDKKLCGRMTLLDDARETLGMSLKRDGHSLNSLNSDEIGQACQQLKLEKPLVMSYTSDQVIIQLASGDSLASLAFSGDAYQAMRDNKDVKYVIAQSGGSLWTDNMCILKSAPHLENAYRWLNFMMEPEVAAATSNYTRYSTPNQDALKYIKPFLLLDKNLYPPEPVLDKCEGIADVGTMITFYDRMWTELKCS